MKALGSLRAWRGYIGSCRFVTRRGDRTFEVERQGREEKRVGYEEQHASLA